MAPLMPSVVRALAPIAMLADVSTERTEKGCCRGAHAAVRYPPGGTYQIGLVHARS